MKVFEVCGKLKVPEEITHRELLEIFYEFLKSKDWHFAGESKEIKQDK